MPKTRIVIIEEEGGPRLALEPWTTIEKKFNLITASDVSLAIKDLELLQEQWSEIEQILAMLPQSWRASDPGKYQSDYSFIGPRLLNRVAVKELLPDGAIFTGTEKEWREYQREHWHNYDKVPPGIPVLNFMNVYQELCPICGTLQPVIRHHVQTEDSYDGDEWMLRYLVICCGAVQVITRKEAGARIPG